MSQDIVGLGKWSKRGKSALTSCVFNERNEVTRNGRYTCRVSLPLGGWLWRVCTCLLVSLRPHYGRHIKARSQRWSSQDKEKKTQTEYTNHRADFPSSARRIKYGCPALLRLPVERLLGPAPKWSFGAGHLIVWSRS